MAINTIISNNNQAAAVAATPVSTLLNCMQVDAQGKHAIGTHKDYETGEKFGSCYIDYCCLHGHVLLLQRSQDLPDFTQRLGVKDCF